MAEFTVSMDTVEQMGVRPSALGLCESLIDIAYVQPMHDSDTHTHTYT